MSEYLEVITFKQRPSGRWWAVRIGSAKPSGQGGFDVYLDALPTDGKLAIRPKREKHEAPAAPPEDDLPF